MTELAGLVQKLVAPDSWQPNGGRGAVRTDAGRLVVMQTGAVHDQVLAFCEKLRTARGKPTRSRLDPGRFALATRWDRAKAMLETRGDAPTSAPPRRWRRSSST